MDPNQSQPQPQQAPQPPTTPLQDIQLQSPVAAPSVFDQQGVVQPVVESQQQVATLPTATPVTFTETPQQVSQNPVIPSPVTVQQPDPLSQIGGQQIQQTPQVAKKSKKKLVIVLAGSLLLLAILATTLFLFVFNGSAEEKAVRGFYSAFNNKDCSKAVSYMAPSLYEGESKDEYIKYCEKNKDSIFDNTGDIEILSLKKLSGDDKKATIEARMKDESKEITVKISLVKTEGKWLLEDAETVE